MNIEFGRNSLRATITVFGLAVILSGCATRPDAADTAAVAAYEEANDPIEPLNRYFFELNNFLDIIILRPAAEIYDGVLPTFAKDGVRHFLDNLQPGNPCQRSAPRGMGPRRRHNRTIWHQHDSWGVGTWRPGHRLGI